MVLQILLAASAVGLGLLVFQSFRLHRRNHDFHRAVRGLTRQEPMAMLGMLLAGIAHELNTPLGAIASSLDTRRRALDKAGAELAALQAGGGDPAESLAQLEKALRAVRGTDGVLDAALERTSAMVRQLRLAGRGEKEETAPVDINALVDGALVLLHEQLKRGITVERELGAVPPVIGRAGTLGSVVLNLVVNARQAMGEQGTLTVATRLDAGRVVLTVADSGPGLPDGAGDCIFNPGWTTKAEDEGTGLGLFISRKIVEDHGGTITAANGPAGGAVFTVLLPVDGSVGPR